MPSQNVTVPAGAAPVDLTVADSFTLAPTKADLATDTVVVVARWVAAFAGRAHRAQVAVATAVTDISLTTRGTRW